MFKGKDRSWGLKSFYTASYVWISWFNQNCPGRKFTTTSAWEHCLVTSWSRAAFTGPVAHTSSKRPWIHITEALDSSAPWQSSCRENTSFSFQSNYCDGPECGKIAHGFPWAASLGKTLPFIWLKFLVTWKHERRKEQWTPRKQVGGFFVYISRFEEEVHSLSKLSESMADSTFPTRLIYNMIWAPPHPPVDAGGILFPVLVECSLGWYWLHSDGKLQDKPERIKQ